MEMMKMREESRRRPKRRCGAFRSISPRSSVPVSSPAATRRKSRSSRKRIKNEGPSHHPFFKKLPPFHAFHSRPALSQLPLLADRRAKRRPVAAVAALAHALSADDGAGKDCAKNMAAGQERLGETRGDFDRSCLAVVLRRFPHHMLRCVDPQLQRPRHFSKGFDSVRGHLDDHLHGRDVT